ncbi:MAG TPA: SoxR reducing system RseC family protein [Candidatus Sulfotelmatobacter sp.]|jgi:sigma-E factor negative regulatory protein RseC|nr:SoxR reducing system RseC family protein [Candidatus Sulfotelmatobacter sp.]
MVQAAEHHRDPSGRTLVEGIARVVSLSEGFALLEPEVSSGCKGCVSAGLCGAMSGGKGSLAARRFTIVNDQGLLVGERVVVGVSETTLVRASWVAYAIPLFGMLSASVTADLWGKNDGLTALAAVAGLGVGLLVARSRAGRMAEKGELMPRYIRHAAPAEQCHTE